VRVDVTIPGGPPLPAAEVSLIRTLAEPVRWRFVVDVSAESWTGLQAERLRKALLTDRCRIVARFRGGPPIGPEATVVGARRVPRESVDYVEIEAEATMVGSPDPFLPRRRVHRVKNLSELFDRFEHVARPVKPLRAKLQAITFPDKEHTSIVQDGISDWAFLFHVFDQARFLAGAPTWLPLALVGSVDESAGTAGTWIVTPGNFDAYAEWNAVAGRTIRFENGRDRDGEPKHEYGSVQARGRDPGYPAATYPVAIEWRPRRKFDAGKWDAWRTADLPRFTTEQGFVVRIEDTLAVKGDEDVWWESRVFAAPPATQMIGPELPTRLQPWLGLGTVDETSASGPWIKVKLPGFEKGDDIIDVRIGTPYSGKNGKRGMHWVPEKGTELMVAWTGRFDQSIVSTENVRSAAAEYVSPSTYLELEHIAHYADVHVKKVGDVTVESNLKMAVKQQTQVDSSQQLRVKADGADLKMSGGTVYTGRGM
jgi:hypothetical protein